MISFKLLHVPEVPWRCTTMLRTSKSMTSILFLNASKTRRRQRTDERKSPRCLSSFNTPSSKKTHLSQSRVATTSILLEHTSVELKGALVHEMGSKTRVANLSLYIWRLKCRQMRVPCTTKTVVTVTSQCERIIRPFSRICDRCLRRLQTDFVSRAR